MRFAARAAGSKTRRDEASHAWRRAGVDACGLQFGRLEMPNDAVGGGPPRLARLRQLAVRRSARRWAPARFGSDMILPLTQNGGPSPIGVSMRNAAQLAIDGFGAPYITLMIEDDHSSADAAAQAAQVGTRRGGATDPRAGVRQRRAVGLGGGEIGGPADDRFLDRRHRRRSGRLSPVLPHPGLRRPDPSIRRLERQEVVRDHGSAKRLRQCRRRPVPGQSAEASTRRWW